MISSAWAFHDTMGGGWTWGDVLAPLIIVVLIALALVFLGGRKSGKGKSARAHGPDGVPLSS